MAEVIIAASLLSCDFSRIGEEVRAVENAGADWLHLDVMDGHFVPNITIGPAIVAAVKKVARVPLDVHLMISEPDNNIHQFIDAGADYLTVHRETCGQIDLTLSSIKNLGGKAGIALNPATPAQTILPFIDMLSLILIMTVNPGFGGQDFIPEALEKVDLIREHIRAGEHKPLLSVDGGINSNTALLAKEKGVNVLAAGSHIFKSTNYRTAIQSLR